MTITVNRAMTKELSKKNEEKSPERTPVDGSIVGDEDSLIQEFEEEMRLKTIENTDE